jgi:hypothetical protein
LSASKVASGAGDDPPYVACRPRARFTSLIPPKDRQELDTLPVGPPRGYVAETQYRSAAGDAMNAIAALQVPLASPRCGFMQSPTVPNVAVGQN